MNITSNQLVTLYLISMMVILAGCIDGNNSQLSGLKTPIWKTSDLESTKLSGYSGQLRKVEITFDEQADLPYYSGTKPLKFIKESEQGIGFGIERPPVYYDFGDFLNLFIHDGLTVIGSQTCDRTGKLLAEAKATYITGNGMPTIRLEEIHYSRDGKPIFKCNSLINEYGTKIQERDKIGTKERDYYFIWPTFMG